MRLAVLLNSHHPCLFPLLCRLRAFFFLSSNFIFHPFASRGEFTLVRSLNSPPIECSIARSSQTSSERSPFSRLASENKNSGKTVRDDWRDRTTRRFNTDSIIILLPVFLPVDSYTSFEFSSRRCTIVERGDVYWSEERRGFRPAHEISCSRRVMVRTGGG